MIFLRYVTEKFSAQLDPGVEMMSSEICLGFGFLVFGVFVNFILWQAL
jgi:hypothetical protein